MQPFRLSALELLSAYRSRRLSPVEAMASVIGRVEAFEPHIAATYLYRPERALAEARASEARWLKGEPIGPLDGVPATVKDNIATSGDPKPLGTAASDMTPEAADAPPAARLSEAGAILFAKTTMPDYGMLSSGLSSHHALARNPWKLDRNPGGSSAGAGAAAAALYGPLHVGTDIGGSIRLPAGWCGIVGLKPSAGRVPIDPPYIGRVAGPMTRDAADAGLMMATLSLPDVRDYSSLNYEKLDWSAKPAALKGLRIGLMLEAGCGAPPSPEVREAVERAARDFEAGRGADRAARALPDPGDARRPRPFLAHAPPRRDQRARARKAGRDPALHPGMGGIGRRASRAGRCSAASARSRRCARLRSRRRIGSTACCRRPRR